MLSALTSLSSLVKTKSYHIDYPLFRLHYRVTVSVLLAFSLVLTAKILFGDAIDCKLRNGKGEAVYDNLCFSQGTYTTFVVQNSEEGKDCLYAQRANSTNGTISTDKSVASRESAAMAIHNAGFAALLERGILYVHKKLNIGNKCFRSDVEYLYPGIPMPLEDDPTFEQRYWHQYYQYIPIILFLQATFFYLPHYLWKVWENGIVSSVCKQLHDNRFSPSDYLDSHFHLIDYIQSCFSLNRDLVYKYYFCHVLLLINLVGQTVLLNAIFNDQFYQYGVDVLRHYFIDPNVYGLHYWKEDQGGNNDLHNPMNIIFPKVTACTLNFLGQVGLEVDTNQFICALPLNIFHDRFYLVLWFWFLFLALLTTVQILINLLYALMPSLRRYMFRKKYGPSFFGENGHSPSLPEIFLLDLIGQNSDKFAFAALLRKLSKEDHHITPSENQSLV